MVIKEILRPLWTPTFGELQKQYIKELNLAVDESIQSLLDVGCGFNSPVQHLRRRPSTLIGVDGFIPAIEQSRAKAIHDDYKCISLLEIERTFGANSFDCVVASDVIEHFSEHDALELIAQMEIVSRRKVIIFTPNGFLPQN